MFPPGWPPSWSFTGSSSRQSYAGPPAAEIAATSFASVWSAATTPLSVPPELSCTSSTEITSGAARLWTIRPARRSNFDCGSLGARFSTLNVATASWSAAGAAVVSGVTPSCATGGSDVASRKKLPKL